MKNVILGTLFALLATSAFAGTLVDPIVEPEIIVEQTASASFDHGIIVPLYFLFFIGLGFLL
ncbi:hypothetical protein [Maritimibacter sp. DP1N21-5]|uniref:hypothetical protein n=1 Tax=Maritimibacter sp. DP1N21-5 TaxID=2836867 RepID=UPI001C441A03|nr:hypothetical protein [Maritimibacter sp. DP1N21-5]MBV7410899.1 hypothetical protein [Maritimibacter sp. DP1N21-5]